MRWLILACFWVYRRFLSRYTQKCPDAVSCSDYAVQVVREHGAREGLELAVAKIKRCGVKMARVPNREDFDSDEEYDGALYALEAPDEGE